MSIYFDPERLTPEQQSRWDWALAEYERIQDVNRERFIQSMSIDRRDEYLTAARRQRPGFNDDLRAYLPPTSYSYPWYDIIEKPGPHSVTVETIVDGLSDNDGRQIDINQCAWRIAFSNDAGERLLVLQKRLAAGKEWTQEIFEALLECYRDRPVFNVCNGPWPEYQLRLGRVDTISQRLYVESEMEIPGDDLARTSDWRNDVFQAERILFNPEIGETVTRSEHPRVKHEMERSRLENASGKVAYPGLARMLHNLEAAELDAEIALFEARPDARDMVRVHYDGWVLERLGG